MSKIILAGTGHRPPRLSLSYSDNDLSLLGKFLTKRLSRFQNVTQTISGGALGFDQAFAMASLELEIPLVLAIPFKGFDKKWPHASRARLENLVGRAAKVVYVCEREEGAFHERDAWMVEHCTHVLTLFDGRGKGGTAYTVDYAKRLGRPVTNLWDDWAARKKVGAIPG